MNAASSHALSRAPRVWLVRLALSATVFLAGTFLMVLPGLSMAEDARREAMAAKQNYLALASDPGLSNIGERLEIARRGAKDAFDRWATRRNRFDILPPLKQTGGEARIHFKIALQEARESLQKRAAEKGFSYPATLGLSETLAAEDNPEERLRQLLAANATLDVLFHAEIAEVRLLAPLLPVTLLPAQKTGESWAVEYPVEVGMVATYAQITAVLRALRSPTHFIALRSFSAVHRGTDPDEPLDVTLVLGFGRMQTQMPLERFVPGRSAESPVLNEVLPTYPMPDGEFVP
jgi:hypothetical protein